MSRLPLPFSVLFSDTSSWRKVLLVASLFTFGLIDAIMAKRCELVLISRRKWRSFKSQPGAAWPRR